MGKKPLKSGDPLVDKLREILKSEEPRDLPTEKRMNPYGFICWVCPYCEDLCHLRGRDGMGGYNMHFAAMHGTPFWKERQIIRFFNRKH